jgi:hypothetical protein
VRAVLYIRYPVEEIPMHVDGTCHCGEVTYLADIDPDLVIICHCTDCQVLSSSAFRMVVLATRGSFRLLTGTPTTYVKTADSGRRRAHHFCPRCGTQMYATPAGDNPHHHYGLRVGSIRQRAALRPSRQLWCKSAFGWVDEIVSIPRSESASLTPP